MTRRPLALALAVLLASTISLPGCGRSSNLSEQEYIQRAKDFEVQGNLKSSILELKNAIQKNPGGAEARLLLGQTYLKVRDGQSAEKELRRARELGVDSELLTPLIGDALLLQGEYQKVLDEILPTDRASAAYRGKILRIRADALFALRQYKDACTLYAAINEQDPRNVPVYWGLANCAYGKRDTALVRSWLDKAVQIDPANAGSWIRLGDYLRLQNAYQEAEAAFAKAVKADPKNAIAYINRAGARLHLNDEKGAKADFKAAQKIAPNDPMVRYMQALFDYRAGKLDAAREKLEAIQRVMPGHFQTNLLLGFVSYRLGNLQTAETYLSRVLSAAPATEDVRLILANTQLRLGDPQKALDTIQPLLREAQPKPEVLALAGDIYMGLQQFSAAQNHYKQAIDAGQRSAEVQTRLARSQLAQGDSAGAIAELQEITGGETKPSAADSLLIMARFSRGEFDRALADIDALEKKQPKNPVASYWRGQAYLGKKDPARAESSFRKALDLEPRFAPAAEGLADLKMREGKPADAAKILNEFLERNPKNLEAMLGLAELARLGNRPEESLNWLDKAVMAHPDALLARQKLVAHHLGENQSAKALVVANETVAKSPSDVNALRLLAQVHLAQGNFDSAVATYTRVTTLQPRLPAAYLELANAQMGARKFSAARESLQKALALAPASVDVKAALVAAEVAEGKQDAALKRAEELQVSNPNAAAGYILAGDLLMKLSRYDEAAARYEKALSLEKSGPVAISQYRALRAAGKDDRAISALAEWVTQTPGDDTARLYLATAYRNAGRTQDALRQFDYLLAKDANNAIVLNEVAIMYKLQKSPKAIDYAERAYKLRPVPAIADTLAMILLEKGDKKRALQLLENAIESGTANPEIRYHHAVALVQNGQSAKAKQKLQELLASKQGFPEKAAARALLAQLK